MASERGKKVDVWEFRISHVIVEIPVKMRLCGYPRSGTEFFVRDDAYSLNLCDADINALKRATEAHLREHLKVEWERFYYIDWHGTLPLPVDDADEPEGEDEDGLRVSTDSHFSCREIEIGTKPDGSKCYREYSRNGRSSYSTNEMPPTGMDDDSWHDGARPMRSLVPATPENKAAIQTLEKAFQALNKKLYGWLASDKIVANLAKASRTLLLSAK